jgi:hypothetical protein
MGRKEISGDNVRRIAVAMNGDEIALVDAAVLILRRMEPGRRATRSDVLRRAVLVYARQIIEDVKEAKEDDE